jgi:hypothetical protein
MSDTDHQNHEQIASPPRGIEVIDETGSVKTLAEFEEREIPNANEITSNTGTITAVANYLNLPENEEF